MKFQSTLLLAAAAGSALAVPHGSGHKKRASVFEWFGSNESGAEFGTNIPGVWGTDYIFPDPSTISTLIGKGMNFFRVQFMMERLLPDSMTGSYDEEYLANLTTVVKAVTDGGAHALIDPHNYGRYNGEIISSTSDFQTFWQNLAGQYKDNDLVMFDTSKCPPSH
ncbi:hypothetical protein ACMYSQ_011447 [Aspergillus niger]